MRSALTPLFRGPQSDIARSVPTLSTVRVAALQATPVILDAEATVEKAARLLGEAAGEGAQLAVLPETFVSVYPSNAWARGAAGFGGTDELWERMWLSSVDVPGPLVDELVEACRSNGIDAVIGVNERESERPGTLYNTMLWLGRRACCTSTASSCPPSTSGSSTASAAATI